MLEKIGSVENVLPYVEDLIASHSKIMGFGHRVYKVKDPRAKILQNLVEKLFEKFGSDKYYEIALEIRESRLRKTRSQGNLPERGLLLGLGLPEIRDS